jgi:predicted kinase
MSRNGLELVVFIGLQGAGKTTCYRCCFARTHEHISKDAWPNARHRQRRQLRLIDQALGAGGSVVVDNTNPAPEDRVQIARMTAARTFELEESATAADPWPVGGRLWNLDQ